MANPGLLCAGDGVHFYGEVVLSHLSTSSFPTAAKRSSACTGGFGSWFLRFVVSFFQERTGLFPSIGLFTFTPSQLRNSHRPVPPASPLLATLLFLFSGPQIHSSGSYELVLFSPAVWALLFSAESTVSPASAPFFSWNVKLLFFPNP